MTIEELLLHATIERFLLAEAEALDERRWDEWLEMLSDDINYTMPMRRNVPVGEWGRENTRPGEEICWFDESKQTLIQRVRQLQTGIHWAEEPVSRVCHIVSAVHIQEATPNVSTPELVRVKSRFIVYRNRQEGETDLFVGTRDDVLRFEESWKIIERRILLDQSVLLAKNLTTFF